MNILDLGTRSFLVRCNELAKAREISLAESLLATTYEQAYEIAFNRGMHSYNSISLAEKYAIDNWKRFIRGSK